MDFVVHTTGEHHGAEIYERWTFPQPEDRHDAVKLEVLSAELSGDVVSVTQMDLSSVPDRAAKKFHEGASRYNRLLGEMLETVDIDAEDYEDN